MTRLLGFLLILLVYANGNEHDNSTSFIGSPPITSSIFDWVPFKLSRLQQSEPLISLKVRAVNRVVFTKKDSLLQEIEDVSEYKKKQEKQFEQSSLSSDSEDVSVDEPDKIYQKGEERKIFVMPKQGDTVTKIGGDAEKSEVLAEESETENSADDDFQIMYDDEKKEYVLKKPVKMNEKGIIDSWNDGNSKESADETKRILEGEEEETRAILGEKEKEKNITEVHLTEENVDLQDLQFKSHSFRQGKSKIRTYDLAWMDPMFLEKEEFSVRLTPKQRSEWRDKLTNKSLLEERSANEHRDYGSSYILPVLKSVDYDNTSVPLAFNDIPVNVAAAFNFLYLANFDSEMMEFSMDVEMEFSWIDIRLVNNYTKPIRIREKGIIEQIWRPDPYIVNSKHSYFHYVSFPNIRMRITPEGLVTYTVRVSSVCSCFMSFCLYPHDRQECDVRISSIAYSNQYVKFHWHSNPIRFQSKITLPELHITKIKTGECYSGGKLVEASCLRIVLSLERDSARFVIEKYVPSTLAMMFAWVAPYVPYNYEDVRIITPITVLLTLVQMEKGDKEIRTSYLTSIDVWFAAMKSFTVLSLLESLAVLALIKRSRAMTKNAERAANEFESGGWNVELSGSDAVRSEIEQRRLEYYVASQMKRDDLQGLRGLAIIAVLAFHFFPKEFPNGYIGVDMFFVLSGCVAVYLLFPSTFVPMNMDSAWNSIFLYHNMAEHSDNNMYFKMLNQAEDIFTHTWSLCVEMQFYILAPLIFFLLSFCSTGLLLTFFHVVIIFTSLGNHLLSTQQVAFNSVFCRVWQFLIGSAVFFLSNELLELDTRVRQKSELLLEEKSDELSDDEEEEEEGMFSKPRQNLSRPPFYILLCSSLSVLILMSFSPWIIPASILRMTCTFLAGFVILTGTLCKVNPLGNRLIVYIGDISYSLYLAHWPLYVYVKHYYENQVAVYLFAIAVSITIAVILSETFEKWYLKLGKQGTTVMIGAFYLLIVSLVLNKNEVTSMIEKVKYGHEEGLVSQVHNSFENVTLEQAIILNKKWAREEYKNLVIPNCYPNISEHGLCEFDKSELAGKMNVFLVGNSLTPNLGPFVFRTFKKHAKSMYKYSHSYCEVLAVANENKCRKAHDKYEEEVFKKGPDVLFILDRPDKLTRKLSGPVEKDKIFKEALAVLRMYEDNVKKKIYILESYTPPKNLPLSKFGQMLENGKNVTQSLFHVDFSYLNALRRQEELVKKCSKCELIRISDVLFDGNQTKSYDEKTKLGYYYDGLHITPFAQNLILPLFQNISDSFH
ncbi:unnamed protein product [Caenorhabditis sp. 36 PRJEB53466]|nr:unnamed protein product [Caenorhabditis sp. 36 PRJEB53466]